MPEAKKNIFFSEDWAVVILGFLIIFLAIVGFKPLSPNLNWNNANDLITSVLTGSNLWKVIVQFGFVLIIAIVHSSQFTVHSSQPKTISN